MPRPLQLLALLPLGCTAPAAPADATTDAPPDLPPPACDAALQDCPAGQKCTGVKPSLEAPYAGTACVPDNAGQGAPAGDTCLTGADGRDTCDPTSMCVQFGWGEGVCVPFCGGPAGAPTCADPSRVCARIDRTWPLHLCVPPCDPLAYDCPDVDLGATTMVCQPATRGFGCVLRGNLGGQPLGAPCTDHRDCTAAAYCAPPGDVPGCPGPDGCCAAYCDLLNDPTCPLAGQTCTPYFPAGEAPPGLDDVGVCAAP